MFQFEKFENKTNKPDLLAVLLKKLKISKEAFAFDENVNKESNF